LTGKIALISRGSCSFSNKSTNAEAAGAVGAVIYNNVEGDLSGTLGDAANYVPTVGISQADGSALAKSLGAADLEVAYVDLTTYVLLLPCSKSQLTES